MKCAVLREAGKSMPYTESRPLRLEDLEAGNPRAGEVLVSITYSSLCHSDLSVVNGSRTRPLPMALGHEGVGRVLQTGPGVSDLEPGDHVVLVFVPSCRTCRYCTSGRPALCLKAAAVNGSGDLLHGPAALRDSRGQRVNHHLGVSAFADQAILARESLVRIPNDIPDQIAAMFGCAVLTGMGAVLNTARAKSGHSMAVFGMGAVGLAAVMAGRLSGADQIIAIDPLPRKRDLALRAGATHAFSPDDTTAIGSLVGGGVDLAIEAVGSARALDAALALTGRGGAAIAVGLPHPQSRLETDALQFAGEGKRLLGSYMGDSDPERDIPAYLEHWRNGTLPVELLHSDTDTLDNINQALDDLQQGKIVRRLFTPVAAMTGRG